MTFRALKLLKNTQNLRFYTERSVISEGYIGKCKEFPFLMFYEKTRSHAFQSIKRFVYHAIYYWTRDMHAVVHNYVYWNELAFACGIGSREIFDLEYLLNNAPTVSGKSRVEVVNSLLYTFESETGLSLMTWTYHVLTRPFQEKNRRLALTTEKYAPFICRLKEHGWLTPIFDK